MTEKATLPRGLCVNWIRNGTKIHPKKGSVLRVKNCFFIREVRREQPWDRCVQGVVTGDQVTALYNRGEQKRKKSHKIQVWLKGYNSRQGSTTVNQEQDYSGHWLTENLIHINPRIIKWIVCNKRAVKCYRWFRKRSSGLSQKIYHTHRVMFAMLFVLCISWVLHLSSGSTRTQGSGTLWQGFLQVIDCVTREHRLRVAMSTGQHMANSKCHVVWEVQRLWDLKSCVVPGGLRYHL